MKKTFAFSVVMLFFLISPIYAQPIKISDYDTLWSNTTYDSTKDALTLRSGEYAIIQPFNLLALSLGNSFHINDSESSLILNATDNRLLIVENFFLGSSGGTLTSTGGFTSNVNGLYVRDTFTQNGGIIKATGGSGNNTMGIYANNFLQTDGILEASGGTGNEVKTYGFYVADNFVQEGGKVVAEGGSMAQNAGFVVDGTYTQKGGIIEAMGGSATETYGAGAQYFVQRGGMIKTTGGSSELSQGFFISHFIQISGSFEAVGGIRSEGLFIGKSMVVSGTLIIARESSVASVYIGATEQDLKLNSSSILRPVIDLSKTTNASGLIIAEKGITILTGATLRPLLKNTARLNVIDSTTDTMTFMQADDSNESHTILGTYLKPIPTITMSYTSRKVNSNSYTLTVTRNATPVEVLENASADENVLSTDIALIKVIYDFLTNEANSNHRLNLVLDEIDNSFEIGEALGIIRRVTPVNKLDYLLWQDIAVKNLADSQMNLINLLEATSDSLMSLSVSLEKEFGFYNDTKVSGNGIALENIYRLNDLTLGLEIKFMPLNTKNNSVETEGTYVSGMVASRYSFNIGTMNPNITLNVGYSYSGISTIRQDYFEEIYEAYTKQNIVTAGLTVGNKFAFAKGFSLSAYAGLSYSYITISAYEEDNIIAMRITAESDVLHSLKPFMRAALNYEAGRFTIIGNVNAAFEILNAFFDGTFNWYDGDEIFTSEDLTAQLNESRFSFQAGLNGSYEVSDMFNLTLGYSFYLHGSYVTHQVGLNFGINF